MQHSFDIEIAKEYGVLEAILLNNLQYWIEKNKANDVNYYDGYYWTFNSTRAFNQLFPYASQRQIQNALKKLKEQEIIQTGNYNKSTYDRTLWYAFTKKGECIMQKCKMEDANLSNGLCKNVEPIPNINTNINTNNKTTSTNSGESGQVVDKCLPDIEQETKTIYDFIEENFNRLLTPLEYQKIEEWLLYYDEDIIKYAVEKSIYNNKKTFSYVNGILNNWHSIGYKTLQEIKENEEKPKQQTNNQYTEQIPEWYGKEIETNEPTKEELEEFERKLEEIRSK
jgi:DnaD/phage-associated family protein